MKERLMHLPTTLGGLGAGVILTTILQIVEAAGCSLNWKTYLMVAVPVIQGLLSK